MSLTEDSLIKDQLLAEGFGFYHLPIRDMDSPLPRIAYEGIRYMKDQIDQGHSFLIHCKGGVGRTGMIAACYLVIQGIPAHEAIRMVRIIHRPYIQTRKQEDFVEHFEKYLKQIDL